MNTEDFQDHAWPHQLPYRGTRRPGTPPPAYDLNPLPVDIKPRVLVTAITEDDNTASLALAFQVAGYFEIADPRAREIGAMVAGWDATGFPLRKPIAWPLFSSITIFELAHGR
jgi:hypothetical protein